MALERGEGSASRPGRSLPPGKTRYPLYRRLGRPQGQSGQVRKISPPTWIRSPDHPAHNQSLYQLSYPAHPKRHKNIINHIKAQRSSWFGHLHRVKKVFKWKPKLTRPLWKPKNRWEDDIINDMMKLKIKNWTSYIQDHNKWKLYVGKGKTFRD
jgi:hypothetical protein